MDRQELCAGPSQFDFTLIKNNTEEKLFNKCLEEYEKFHIAQRGGPLIMSLVVRRIQNSSDEWVDCLTRRFEKIKITDYKGEDVDKVVSILRGCYCHNTFISVSTKYDNRFPKDWNKKLLLIFSASSVHEFNKIFNDWHQRVQVEADANGGMPVWPHTDKTLRLATVSCDRIKSNGNWDVRDRQLKRKAHPGIMRDLISTFREQCLFTNPNTSSQPLCS